MGAVLAAVRHLTGRLNKQSIRELIPEATPAEEKLISRALSMSMTSPERIWANLNAIKYMAENRIPGDLVEFGVWRGGGAVFNARGIVNL